MGIAVKELVKEKFIWKVKAQEIYQVYQETLGRAK
jgi:hypothetical protein